MQGQGYEKGMAQVFWPKCDSGCSGRGEYVCENGFYHDGEFTGKAFLPHSCSEWIIGSAEQIDLLIADLQHIRATEYYFTPKLRELDSLEAVN